MSDTVILNAKVRELRGSANARRERIAGTVPCVVYGKGLGTVALDVKLREVAALIRADVGVKSTFTLAIEGGETCEVKFQARQIDPVKGRLVHADFLRV